MFVTYMRKLGYVWHQVTQEVTLVLEFFLPNLTLI